MTTGGKLIQGGTYRGKGTKLKEAIKGGFYAAFIFPNRNGFYDLAPFGHATRKATYEEVVEIGQHKLVPVPLKDVEPGSPWTYNDMLMIWWAAMNIKKQLEAGMTVVIACVGGKNRSLALKYAVDPDGKYAAEKTDFKLELKCPLMRKWAEGFQTSPGVVSIRCLVAEERAPVAPVALNEAPAPLKVAVGAPINVAALQERIRQRDLATRKQQQVPSLKRYADGAVKP